MNYSNVTIFGIEKELPEKVVSSSEIENRLETFYKESRYHAGRLELMTGIKERRVWERGVRPSEMGIAAAKKLLNKNIIEKKLIELCIHGSVCRDFLEPATASVEHSALGLSSDCQFFDLSNACLGGVNSIDLLAKQIEAGQIEAGLVICSENSGPLLEKTLEKILAGEFDRKSFKKIFANLTIGSGAVAIGVCHKKYFSQGFELFGSVSVSDSASNHLCQGTGDITDLIMETQSEKMLQAGIELVRKTFLKFHKETGLKQTDISKVIGHQVGEAHSRKIMESLEISQNKEVLTYPVLGNTGSAALPLTLEKALSEKLLPTGENVLLLGIGSGLSCTMMGGTFHG